MKPEPVFEAAEAALSRYTAEERAAIPVILLTPQGELLSQRLVEELTTAPGHGPHLRPLRRRGRAHRRGGWRRGGSAWAITC